MKKFTAIRLAAIPAFVLATASAAHADVPAAVATAINAAKDDMLTTGGLVITAMVAVWGLMKLASKFGWR